MHLMILCPVVAILMAFSLNVAYAERPPVEAVLNAKQKELMKARGHRYEATVPDTLDLAERARLSVNVMLGNIEPAKEYSVYQAFRFSSNPPEPGGLTWNIQHKNIRVLPMLRTMCGSERGLDLEYETMKNVLSQLAPDGMLYFPIGGDNVPVETSTPLINALAGLAVEMWYHRDGNPAWLDFLGLISKGLRNSAIKREDRAYYPLESGWGRDGKWHWTLRGKAITAYAPPDEPVLDYQGIEGAVKFDNAVPLRALIKSYRYHKDSGSIGTARQLSRFILKPSMWLNTGGNDLLGYQHGKFYGHFHGNVTPLFSLLELAIAENDQQLKEFVREGYEHGRTTGVARMGFFPGWFLPNFCERSDSYSGWAEGCGISDMVVLAVKLTDAGLGDYWDDVDAYVRNQLIAQQFVDLDQMRRLSGNDPKNDELLKRFLGGFGSGEPTATAPTIHGCCSANGAIGLYYAWHGITRFHNGIAKVNLFLNRASDWMDIDSYLPYEGKVVLRNKKARAAWVRIPSWVERKKLKSFVNGKPAEPALVGNSLFFENLGKTDTIRLQFPVPEETDEHIIHRTKYMATYRGSTIVDIKRWTPAPRFTVDKKPPSPDRRMYRMYQRDHMRADKAPMRKVERFVSEHILPLQ